MCSRFILDKCVHTWSYSGLFPYFNILYSCLLYTKSLGQHQFCKLSKLFQRLLAEIIFLKYSFLKTEATSRCLIFLLARAFGCPELSQTGREFYFATIDECIFCHHSKRDHTCLFRCFCVMRAVTYGEGGRNM